MKLRWLIDHHDAVRKAHEEDDLLFGTVESWIVYVSFIHFNGEVLLTGAKAFDRQKIACDGSIECLSNVVDEHRNLAVGPGAPKILPHKAIRPPQDRIFISGVRRG